MTLSTIERAYAMARSGEAPDLESLTLRLKDEGCRAVDALLRPRSIRNHLQAICLAAYAGATAAEADRVLEPAHEQ